MECQAINQLFDMAVRLAHASVADPDDALVLSLFGWLTYLHTDHFAYWKGN